MRALFQNLTASATHPRVPSSKSLKKARKSLYKNNSLETRPMSVGDEVTATPPPANTSPQHVSSATRGLAADVWARIWPWLELDETRAPSVVCHEFLRSFTFVKHVSISEEHLMDKLKPPRYIYIYIYIVYLRASYYHFPKHKKISF